MTNLSAAGRHAKLSALMVMAGAALQVACGGGASTDPALEPLAIERKWEFYEEIVNSLGVGLSEVGQGYQLNGVVDDEYIYNSASASGSDARKAEVYSNDTGTTWWVGAQSPRADPTNPDGVIGNEVSFEQDSYFRKKSEDATFEVVLSSVTLDSFDGIPNPPKGYECPDRGEHACDFAIYGDIIFTLWSQRAKMVTVNEVSSFQLLPEQREDLNVDGIVQLYGYFGNWQWDAGHYGATAWERSTWEKSDFKFTSEVLGGHVKLAHPIVYKIPLEHVQVGEIFVVHAEVQADTVNHRQFESNIEVYLRDPQKADGVGYRFSGVEPVSALPLIVGPVPERSPAAACPGAPQPAAGVLQIDAPEFEAVESWRRGARVSITRSGGSAGEVSARLTTADGSAVAGLNYAATSVNVVFADGEEGSRTVRIPLIDDAVENDPRSLRVNLSDLSGCATLGTQTEALVTVYDDEGRLTAPPPLPSYTVGGTVTGLTGSGLLLSGSPFNALSIVANGAYTFSGTVPDGTSYDVRVAVQPNNPAQICTVTNGQGTVQGANVANLAIDCIAAPSVGALDPGFGSGGKVALTALKRALKIVLQPDGKLVVLGDKGELTRYNAEGLPDLGFGNAGLVHAWFNRADIDTPRGVALQTDGKIVVAGTAYPATGTDVDIGVARYNADGSLDTSFGNAGVVLIDNNGTPDDGGLPLIQPDGKILVAGNSSTLIPLGADTDFAVYRLTSTGAIDSSFGVAGRARTNIAGRADFVSAAMLQADGKIVVGGRVASDGGALPDVGLVRFNANGTLDTSFGAAGTGVVRLDTGGTRDSDEVTGLDLQADGKIVATAQARIGGVYRHALLRLDAGGRLDAGFGTGGLATQSFSAGGDFARAVAVQPDGKILTTGYVQPSASSSDNLLVTRHNADGSLDTSFGDTGKVIVDFFGASDGGECLVIQPDGKIVAAGLARSGTSNILGMVRVLP